MCKTVGRLRQHIVTKDRLCILHMLQLSLELRKPCRPFADVHASTTTMSTEVTIQTFSQPMSLYDMPHCGQGGCNLAVCITTSLEDAYVHTVLGNMKILTFDNADSVTHPLAPLSSVCVPHLLREVLHLMSWVSAPDREATSQ